MKKAFIVIPLLLLAALFLTGCGQSAERLNNEGNEAFANQDYQGALAAYHQALEDTPELVEPHYNAANTHYRLQDYGQAQQEIKQALVAQERQEDLDQSSYYNLGNVLFQTQQYEAAVEAYEEALRLNPDDLQAKQNLELALRQLQQQQDQQNHDQDQQDQQQNDQQQEGQQDQQQNDQQQEGQQDQQQNDQQQEGQQDQQQDPQQDDKQQEGQQDQHQASQQDENQQQDGQQDDALQDDEHQNDQADGQPQKITGLTREQAQQLFEAAAQGTKSLEQFLQQILVFPAAPPTEDW